MYKQRSLERLGPPASVGYSMEDGCISRIPFSSVIAFAMCLVGVIMFSAMTIFSFNASVEQARRTLNINDIPWLDKINIFFLIVAIIMVAMALFLLCVGIVSTGSTREHIYQRAAARRGGRIFCIMAMVLSYILNIVWMIVLSITAILSVIYFIFSRLCSSLSVYTETNCLDLSVFKPLVKEYSDATLVLCGGNVQQFCALTNTVVSWYIVGFIGSLIICLGMIQFLASNAANYSHVNSEQRYNELRDVVISEVYPEYSATPHTYAPPKYPLGPMNGTMSTYNYGTQPRDYPLPNSQQGTLLRQQPYSNRRNSYHNSLHENGWMSSQY